MFPKIGDIITTERAIALCKYFGFLSLVHRIELNPESFKDWKFDGCSCVPDQLLGVFTGEDWQKITEQCLRHDLRYAYGSIRYERIERPKADKELKENLVNYPLP